MDDLATGAEAGEDLADAILAERAHAEFAGAAAELGGGEPGVDHLADLVIHSYVFAQTPLKVAQAKSCATFLENKYLAFQASHALTKTSHGAKFHVANSENTKGPLPQQ